MTAVREAGTTTTESPDRRRQVGGDDCSATTAELQQRLREFGEARGWDRVSTPTALLLSLVGEVGEVAQHFRWLTPTQAAAVMQDEQTAKQVREEIADVYWCLLGLSDVLDIDLTAALLTKIKEMERRHPLDADAVAAPDPMNSPPPKGS